MLEIANIIYPTPIECVINPYNDNIDVTKIEASIIRSAIAAYTADKEYFKRMFITKPSTASRSF